VTLDLQGYRRPGATDAGPSQFTFQASREAGK
jgi:hypothetical protein